MPLTLNENLQIIMLVQEYANAVRQAENARAFEQRAYVNNISQTEYENAILHVKYADENVIRVYDRLCSHLDNLSLITKEPKHNVSTT